MKYRYLKISASIIWGTNELTRDDLAGLIAGKYDNIIDLQNGTQYCRDNTWEEIEGDK